MKTTGRDLHGLLSKRDQSRPVPSEQANARLVGVPERLRFETGALARLARLLRLHRPRSTIIECLEQAFTSASDAFVSLNHVAHASRGKIAGIHHHDGVEHIGPIRPLLADHGDGGGQLGQSGYQSLANARQL